MAKKQVKEQVKLTAAEQDGILFFHLAHCPHCLRARQLMAEVYANHPEYRAIPIREINERKESKLANQYDYYYVPAYFVNGKKVHEGVPSYDKILAVFEAAAERA